MSAGDWDPASYDTFATARQRPAADLLAAIADTRISTVTDLGCGSGLSTELLAARWPGASITGIDRSTSMLYKARTRLPDLRFTQADIGTYHSEIPQDLLFANASLHWLGDHTALLPSLLTHLRSGGVLAIQMPDNLREPSHRLMDDVAQDMELGTAPDATGQRQPLLTAEQYYDLLVPLCDRIDIFTIHYCHPLDSPEAIATWFASTGLKPYIDDLKPSQREGFLCRYEEALRSVYPPRVDGKVLLRLPRLFIIATRS